MARWLVTKRAIFARLYFAFCFDETRESIRPSVQFWKYFFVTRQIFGLIVAVCFIFSELDVLPQSIGTISVLVIGPHYEELRTSAADGFKQVRFGRTARTAS